MVEGLLTHPVAREHEAAVARVPQRQPEHPVERVQEVESLVLVEVRQHLRITAGAKAVTLGLERGA